MSPKFTVQKSALNYNIFKHLTLIIKQKVAKNGLSIKWDAKIGTGFVVYGGKEIYVLSLKTSLFAVKTIILWPITGWIKDCYPKQVVAWSMDIFWETGFVYWKVSANNVFPADITLVPVGHHPICNRDGSPRDAIASSL